MSDLEAQEERVFQFDSLLSPDFTKTPHPYYKHMRDTNPVLRTQSMYGDGTGMVWVASMRTSRPHFGVLRSTRRNSTGTRPLSCRSTTTLLTICGIDACLIRSSGRRP